MAIHAIGDIHGTLPDLKKLLAAIAFDPRADRLWFVGDLINRGPESLETVRFVRDLGDRAITLMGNHEMRAIAMLAGDRRPIYLKNLGYLLDAPDRAELFEWFRRRPFFHHDAELGWSMVHAGIPPAWSLEEAEQRARDLERVMVSEAGAKELCRDLWRVLPEMDGRPGQSRERRVYALTVFTRIRLCKPDGEVFWPQMAKAAGLDPFIPPPEKSPYKPWHQMRTWKPGERLLFGHWSAARLQIKPPVYGLDSGCAFGGQLTAMRLDAPGFPRTQVQCPEYVDPNED